MAINPFKRQGSSVKVIGTHSGTFHCDGTSPCQVVKQNTIDDG